MARTLTLPSAANDPPSDLSLREQIELEQEFTQARSHSRCTGLDGSGAVRTDIGQGKDVLRGVLIMMMNSSRHIDTGSPKDTDARRFSLGLGPRD